MENEYDPRYKEGKIYKLVCNITGETYYGSTILELNVRLSLHKNKYEKNKEKILERAKEKITCECGAIVNRRYLTEHKKTLKHKKLTECLIID